MKDARHDDTAAEARDLVRRAVGDASGLTIKGQIKRATENLGYPVGAWRPREAWYSRAGRWTAAALDDLRRRFTAWRDREAARTARGTLAQRVAAVRRLLTDLDRQVAGLEAEVGHSSDGGSAP